MLLFWNSYYAKEQVRLATNSRYKHPLQRSPELKCLLHLSFQHLQFLLKDIHIKRLWTRFFLSNNKFNYSLFSANIISLFRTVCTYLHFTTGGVPVRLLLPVVWLNAAKVIVIFISVRPMTYTNLDICQPQNAATECSDFLPSRPGATVKHHSCFIHRYML